MSDTTIYPLTTFVRSSKHRSYQAQIHRNAEALRNFLVKNELLAMPTTDEVLRSRDLFSSDLTDEGAAFLRRFIFGWLRRTGEADKEENVTYLERELEKWRASPPLAEPRA